MIMIMKRILRKEKIDRQIASQSSSTPFKKIKDGNNSKKVTLNTGQFRGENRSININDEHIDSSG